MRIAFLSTFPPQTCGIGTYCENLARYLQAQGHEIRIFAEAVKGLPSTDLVKRTWTRSYTINALSIREFNPDVLHIQHEFGLFPEPDQIWKLIANLGSIPTFITLHTVTAAPRHVGFFTGYKKAHFIVHSPAAMAILTSRGDWPVHLIPHGVLLRERYLENEAKDRLHLPNRIIVLSPGFMSPSKGHKEIIEAFAKALEAAPSLYLVIVGECRDGNYYTGLEGFIKDYALGNSCRIIASFQADLLPFLSASKIVVLGNWKGSPYSASGQLHETIGCGLPVLAKNAPIYQYSGNGVLYYNDSNELASFMISLSQNQKIYNYLVKEAQTTAKQRSWSTVAEQHMEVYKECVK